MIIFLPSQTYANQLCELPPELGWESIGCQLTQFALAENWLTHLPDEFCLHLKDKLSDLDLTNNRLNDLPFGMQKFTQMPLAHQYDGLKKRGLWLTGNPMAKIPRSVWQTDRTAALFEYLKVRPKFKT
ncbi:unnamed protein product [Protopolystoma xenopodis]|uniref:Uncharacterized protein n=1 Tax=Protopolystoma xenopodis TaxID=117903 RepID=A0A3S4ZNR6_9PLAT|nr:unnamed protein product [Protopolystoma xenopodis]